MSTYFLKYNSQQLLVWLFDFVSCHIPADGSSKLKFSVSADFSSVLLKIEVPVVPNGDCRKLYRKHKPITNLQICAGGLDARDSCSGDSGGPLQTVEYLNEDVRFVQHGVLSYGLAHCGLRGFPAIYTRVASYMNWILDNMVTWKIVFVKCDRKPYKTYKILS